MDSISGRLAVVQHGMHLFRDWHFDALHTCQAERGVRRQHTSGTIAVHTGDDLGRGPSMSESYSPAPLAGEPARARENQIAKPGKTAHRFALTATSHDKSCDFGKAAGDQRGD